MTLPGLYPPCFGNGSFQDSSPDVSWPQVKWHVLHPSRSSFEPVASVYSCCSPRYSHQLIIPHLLRCFRNNVRIVTTGFFYKKNPEVSLGTSGVEKSSCTSSFFACSLSFSWVLSWVFNKKVEICKRTRANRKTFDCCVLSFVLKTNYKKKPLGILKAAARSSHSLTLG